MRRVRIGNLELSRLVIGGNPFSGFSHQSPQRDQEMRGFYTDERIHQVLRQAEAAGIDTLFARTDDHIMGMLRDYWAGGGAIQWVAQVVFDPKDTQAHRGWIQRAGDMGARGMYLHGGATDSWHAAGQFDLFHDALERMRGFGVPAGFAGHRPAAHQWLRDNVRPDFQMCSYYNPTDRRISPQHTNVGEKWNLEDRAAMLKVIATLPTPAVHYKVFGGGNRPVDEAFEVMSRSVRPQDIVCIGVFIRDMPDMIARDVELFERCVERSR